MAYNVTFKISYGSLFSQYVLLNVKSYYSELLRWANIAIEIKTHCNELRTKLNG